jgi:chorismate synthase
VGSNSFGKLFKITTWGESHGEAIGVVIDGCPAGLEITEEEIQKELSLRQPGKNPYTSPRTESDTPQIVSGVFEGKTTGAPISIVIPNRNADPSHYEPIKDLLRPGHANFTYLEKYGIFDYRGGGRSSGRETAARVAAGAIAKKILARHNITLMAYIKEVGGIVTPHLNLADLDQLKARVLQSPVFCPHQETALAIMQKIKEVKEEGDSLGGVIELIGLCLPIGLGDPIYEKLEANLAKAMLTLPATKGVEFGSGFLGARMKGSEHNDLFILDENGRVSTETNHAGGTLGGISTGMPLIMRVAFKPTSSIRKAQKSLDLTKEVKEFKLPEGSRHDPCLTLRAVPIVEAMGALVIVDALLMDRCARL